MTTTPRTVEAVLADPTSTVTELEAAPDYRSTAATGRDLLDEFFWGAPHHQPEGTNQ